MNTSNQISEHEIRTYDAVREAQTWITTKEISSVAGVARRTSRQHASSLENIGVLEVRKVFGGFRYRLTADPKPKAQQYIDQIEQARHAIFGVVK